MTLVARPKSATLSSILSVRKRFPSLRLKLEEAGVLAMDDLVLVHVFDCFEQLHTVAEHFELGETLATANQFV